MLRLQVREQTGLDEKHLDDVSEQPEMPGTGPTEVVASAPAFVARIVTCVRHTAVAAVAVADSTGTVAAVAAAAVV